MKKKGEAVLLRYNDRVRTSSIGANQTMARRRTSAGAAAAFSVQRPPSRTVLLIAIVFVTHAMLINLTNAMPTDADPPTYCEHLRSAESRRAKALASPRSPSRVRVPKCTQLGDFEPVQCSNDLNDTSCWCVDEYGIEIPGTRGEDHNLNCSSTALDNDKCSAVSCRMFCPSGFARDTQTGCAVCKCRDPCAGVECPGGLACQPQEVKCKREPCAPIPTCKHARSLYEFCPAGQPLTIADTPRPFLCGLEEGKPQCPPMYKCLVENGNDYGVCCPGAIGFKKSGECPSVDAIQVSDASGHLCGMPCAHDLECPNMEKCCMGVGCGLNCQQPGNLTTCHQARMRSENMSVNDREGRGYIPECANAGGKGPFRPKQCSRNGLVCWCVDPKTGHKIKDTMSAANMVDCDEVDNLIARSIGRSADMAQRCDQNNCAAVCEYGFKNDHNGCPSCECSEPCEGFQCPMGSHCEVAKDALCASGSVLCASEPVCKPDLVYSNPCSVGTPLTDNVTSEILFCHQDQSEGRAFQAKSFFDVEDDTYSRAMTNKIMCPSEYECTKLAGEVQHVCCQRRTDQNEETGEHQQTMCEYLRDFAERMEGTEEGMELALSPPVCTKTGSYEPMQCKSRKIKVNRSEQRQFLEQNNIRQMRKLLGRKKRSENLQLTRVDTDNSAGIQGRSAKVIDFSNGAGLQSIEKIDVKDSTKRNQLPDIVEMEVEECWCVDDFGTEIPSSKGANTSMDSCVKLRESLTCLDLTCRMGCEYGFILDPQTRCPACECRDPCDSVDCPSGQECRTVEVSCEGEYCPPVPACLPRKPGQCPFLVPPGSDDSLTNECDYECRSDYHCDGAKRCCSNGCGTQCVDPELKTACQHLQTIQLHQATELGLPGKDKFIVQCNSQDGSYKPVQCAKGECWCVDSQGNEITGTKTSKGQPNCDAVQIRNDCPLLKCHSCEHGYASDDNGCQTCECRDPCKEITCPGGEECHLINIECINSPCPRMPICVPRRDSICSEGGDPLRLSGREVSCGPQSDAELCPTTHTCQLETSIKRGVCCAKSRDVCFESIESDCLVGNKSTDAEGSLKKWRFSPMLNKCVQVLTKIDAASCTSKNLFHNEQACTQVCPLLSQCERLRLKNSMAAKRSGQASAWFQPRCDPDTGTWSPVQCLGRPSTEEEVESNRALGSDIGAGPLNPIGVCWCADRKGAPVKGSLTRGIEPVCNHRQARKRSGLSSDEDGESILRDPVMEELIRQMTIMADDTNFVEDEGSMARNMKTTEEDDMPMTTQNSITTIFDFKENELPLLNQIKIRQTRCESIRKSAQFPVECDENGRFLPTQCNDKVCWCVDDAGNQLAFSRTFEAGTYTCQLHPIETVSIELHLKNIGNRKLPNAEEQIRSELKEMLGGVMPDNFKILRNPDNNFFMSFDLVSENKVDQAFALEEMAKEGTLRLAQRHLIPDVTLSRFIHRSTNVPMPEPALAATPSSFIPESTFQTIVFILATASAFLVSIFVVFVMLKRGKSKQKNFNADKFLGGDKYLDYSAPIFVLSPDDKGAGRVEPKEGTRDEN